MEHIENEDLNQILDRINGWIGNCDSKVSIILSGFGVFAGILLATDYVSKFISIIRFMCKTISIWTILYLVVSFLSLVLLMYGIGTLVFALFAKVNAKEYECKGVKTDSLIFFSSIANNNTLSKYKEKLKNSSHQDIYDDLASQIFVCSLICDKKFALYNKGVRVAVIGFSLFIVMAIVGVIIV